MGVVAVVKCNGLVVVVESYCCSCCCCKGFAVGVVVVVKGVCY